MKSRLLSLRLFSPLLVLAAVTAVTLFLAYQVRPTYAIEMDDSFDRVYLSEGFYGQEGSPGSNYRWMSGRGVVQIKGAGRQSFRLVMHMVTDAQDPLQNKPLQVYVRGALVAVFNVTNTPTSFEAAIAPDLISRSSGDVTLLLTTDAFTPDQDARELGAAISSITLEPSVEEGVILPPLLHGLYTLGTGACLYFIVLLLGLSRRWGLWLSLGAIVTLAIVYAFARPYLTFYAGGLLLASAMAMICLGIARLVVERLFRRGNLHDFSTHTLEARLLFTIFVVGLLIAWGGLLYPLSSPNDFGFHLHRFEEVQQGNLFFENYVVAGVGLGFYPPAMYVLLLPLSLVVEPYYLLRFVPALLDFSMVFVLFYLCKQYLGRYRAAPLLTATLYAAVPINLLVLWWAHLTNLFGLIMLFTTVAYIVLNYERITRLSVWVGLLVLWFIVLVSHPAVLVWGMGLGVASLAIFAGLRRFTGRGSYKAVLLLGAAFLTAAVLAFVLYYSRYVGVFGTSATVGGREVANLDQTLARLGNLDEIMAGAALTFRHGFLLDYALWPLILAPVGIVLLFRTPRLLSERQNPDDSHQSSEHGQEIEPRGERFRWVLLIWLVIGASLLVGDQILRLPDRPMLFLWPVVSILAGLVLAAFVDKELFKAHRIGWRSAMVGLALAGLAAMSLYFWAQANFLDQRQPHIFPHVF